MLPPLFGVSWGMYAVIIVGLVLILALVVVSRRRKQAATSAKLKTKPTPKSAAAKRAVKATPPLTQTTPPAMSSAPSEMPPALPIAPAPLVHAVPIEAILPGADPLQAVIAEMLHGWGDLTQEDTNRLLVFRTDRVLASVAVAEIPKELKTNEYARARLAQLRRWASGLEKGEARPAQAVQTPQSEYAGISPMTQAAPAPQAPLQQAPPTPATPATPAMAAAAAAATAAAMAAAPAVPAPPVPAPAAPFFSPAPPMPASAADTSSWLQSPTQAEAAPLAPAPVEPAPIAAPAPVAAAPAPMAAPFAPLPPATPAPVAQPVTAEPRVVGAATPWQSNVDDAARSTEAAIAAAAAAFWARPELSGTPVDAVSPSPPTPPLAPPMPQYAPAQPAPAQPAAEITDTFALGQELPTLTVSAPVVQAPSFAPLQPTAQPAPRPGSASDTFLQDLGSRVSTAEALLAVPPSEQPGLLAFLKPSELAKVMQATSDTELKLAVIDTLESVGSPSALDIIYHSLDDPDPQIQSRALQAADRLLGAE